MTEKQGPGFSAAQYVKTTAFLHEMVTTGTFLGATAWTRPNLIVYAVERARVGHRETPRAALAKAFDGKVLSTVVRVPQPGVPDPSERAYLVQHGPLLEVFIPVRPGGKLVAAVQLYQPWQPVESVINHETYSMLLLVAAGLLVLWLGLISLVLSASRRLRAQARENLRLASHDALTGLPNRTVLYKRAELALCAGDRTGRGIALLLLDLDRFKDVNDTLGHHYGDLLLQQVGPRLEGVIRANDMVVRLGGDEFVILLTESSGAAEAIAAARRIQAVLSAPFILDNAKVDVDVSVGIALSPEHGTDCEKLLQHADAAMYSAKSSGSGFAVDAADAAHSRSSRKAPRSPSCGRPCPTRRRWSCATSRWPTWSPVR